MVKTKNLPGNPESKPLATSKKPKYKKADDAAFYPLLRKRIRAYFQESGLKPKGGKEVTIKTVALLLLYVSTYLLMISNWFSPFGTLLMAISFGIINVLIVFNIAHDAAHNALFPNAKLNRILTYTFNMLGANAYLWDITHNQIHHTYPNVGAYDTDIEQQAPLIRVSPTVDRKWFHRYQAYYAPFLYLTYSVFLIFLKDYQDIGILPKKDSKLLENRKHPIREYLIFFASKIFYLCIGLIIPFLLIDVSWQQFLLGFFIVHLVMSFLLAVVLIPVHMVDEAPFEQVSPSGTIEESWSKHVLNNTTDYSANSRLANIFFGGLNTHLVHHLFPGICHVHYMKLSGIVKETAQSLGLEYRNVSMWQAICSHFRLLKRMGKAGS
jgi:linoleoyl-CoA desaturase